MITVVNHHSTYPSYFYIENKSELSQLPDCRINSKAVNITDKALWILVGTEENKKWHKFGSSEEVVVNGSV